MCQLILTISGLWYEFLLTRPSRDVTYLHCLSRLEHLYFYSHVPRGTWLFSTGISPIWPNFYSHVPRGTWHTGEIIHNATLVISTHTSLAGRDVIYTIYAIRDAISTHTSLAGRDQFSLIIRYSFRYFYSHVPRGTWPSFTLHVQTSVMYFYSHVPRGTWHCNKNLFSYFKIFLLTRPSRDVTSGCQNDWWLSCYFYSHVPRGTWLVNLHFW